MLAFIWMSCLCNCDWLRNIDSKRASEWDFIRKFYRKKFIEIFIEFFIRKEICIFPRSHEALLLNAILWQNMCVIKSIAGFYLDALFLQLWLIEKDRFYENRWGSFYKKILKKGIYINFYKKRNTYFFEITWSSATKCN